MTTPASTANSGEAQRRARIGVIRPGWQELSILLAAVLLSVVGISLGTSVPLWINIVSPVLLSVGLVVGVVTMVRANPAAVWTSLLWVRIVMIAYSGVGSVVPFIANDTTLDIMDRFFTLFPLDMVKYNAVVAVFTLVMLLAARLVAWFVGEGGGSRGVLSARIQACALDARQFALVALAVSMPIKILFRWIPFVTGVDVNLPATVLMLGTLSYVAYPLLIYHALTHDRRLLWLPVPLMLLEVALGALAFNKSEALFPIIFGFLGLLFHRPTLRRVTIGAGAIILVYWLLVPFTTFGRSQVGVNNGALATVTLESAIGIAGRYEGNDGGRVGREQYQAGIARLSYITGGSYAVSQYDQGIPGGTLDNALTILIPRAIYPDKPDVTRVFRDFNYALTGSDESQSGPGIPPEAYWNYGWLGVIGMAAIMGVVYALWSLYAVATLQAGAWHLLFVSLLGIRVAARIDGLIATDFIPMIPIAIVAHLGLSFANKVILGRKSRRAAASVAAAAGGSR